MPALDLSASKRIRARVAISHGHPLFAVLSQCSSEKDHAPTLLSLASIGLTAIQRGGVDQAVAVQQAAANPEHPGAPAPGVAGPASPAPVPPPTPSRPSSTAALAGLNFPGLDALAMGKDVFGGQQG